MVPLSFKEEIDVAAEERTARMAGLWLHAKKHGWKVDLDLTADRTVFTLGCV